MLPPGLAQQNAPFWHDGEVALNQAPFVKKPVNKPVDKRAQRLHQIQGKSVTPVRQAVQGSDGRVQAGDGGSPAGFECRQRVAQ